MKDLIKKMLKLEEKDRISWEELFEHKYFSIKSELQSLSESFCNYDEVRRQSSIMSSRVYCEDQMSSRFN